MRGFYNFNANLIKNETFLFYKFQKKQRELKMSLNIFCKKDLKTEKKSDKKRLHKKIVLVFEYLLIIFIRFYGR